MEDNNDKLDEFFRRQLRDEDRSQGDWDRPDPFVWKQAQERLAVVPEQKKRRALLWPWWLAGGLLVGGTLFFIAYLLRTNQTLQQEILRKEEIVLASERQTQELLLEYRKKVVRLEDEIVTVKNTYEQDISAFSAQYEQQLKTVKRDLLNAQTALKYLSTPSNDLTPKPIFEVPVVASENMVWGLLHGLPSRETPLLPTRKTKVQPEVIILQNHTTGKAGLLSDWEIGFGYGRPIGASGYMAEWKEGERGEELRQDVSVHSYQLHLGYSPRSNWWITAGGRMTQYRSASSFGLLAQYDKDREYTKPNGKRANDLNVQTTDDYLDSNWRVSVENGDEVNLEDEDALSGSFTHAQSYQLWQFPLKVEYRKRKNQWGWQLHAGALGNYLRVFEEELEGQVFAREESLLVEFEKADEGPKGQKFFWGLEAGLGASYQLRQQLLLRGDLLYQYDFTQWRPVAQLGLGYQF